MRLPREPRVFHYKPSGPTAYLVQCQRSIRAFGLKGSPCHVIPGYCLYLHFLIVDSLLNEACGKKGLVFFRFCSRMASSFFIEGLAKAHVMNKKRNMCIWVCFLLVLAFAYISASGPRHSYNQGFPSYVWTYALFFGLFFAGLRRPSPISQPLARGTGRTKVFPVMFEHITVFNFRCSSILVPQMHNQWSSGLISSQLLFGFVLETWVFWPIRGALGWMEQHGCWQSSWNQVPPSAVHTGRDGSLAKLR